jgi:hypothetical protein
MSFTVRVELHDATEEDYEQLHAAMEQQGFSRLIESDDGIVYHLSTAEYNYHGEEPSGDVLGGARRAASTTGLSFAVLVTESKGRTWHGLNKAA